MILRWIGASEIDFGERARRVERYFLPVTGSLGNTWPRRMQELL